jgi:hypothetical protein
MRASLSLTQKVVLPESRRSERVPEAVASLRKTVGGRRRGQGMLKIAYWGHLRKTLRILRVKNLSWN